MIKQNSMFLFYFSISLAIASSALYHFSQKGTPANVNPAVSILVSYVVAFFLILSLLFFLPAKNGIIEEVRRITERWLEDYNTIRPHEALKGVSPRQFALQIA